MQRSSFSHHAGRVFTWKYVLKPCQLFCQVSEGTIAIKVQLQDSTDSAASRVVCVWPAEGAVVLKSLTLKLCRFIPTLINSVHVFVCLIGMLCAIVWNLKWFVIFKKLVIVYFCILFVFTFYTVTAIGKFVLHSLARFNSSHSTIKKSHTKGSTCHKSFLYKHFYSAAKAF